MSTEVVMPRMGETVDEGTVNVWHKAVGDPVTEGEPLLEIGTDKVDTDIPAPVSGTLAEIRVEADQTVPVGTVIAVISAGPGGRSASAGETPRTPGPAAARVLPDAGERLPRETQ
jgi:pyruvate dehydrogenase E2 component (dihydrolipoamide acetyltransferase)